MSFTISEHLFEYINDSTNLDNEGIEAIITDVMVHLDGLIQQANEREVETV